MKLLTTISIPVLMLGAFAFVTPALAQSGAGASAPAQSGQNAMSGQSSSSADASGNSSAAISSQSDQTAMNGQSSSSAGASSGNTQMAMNTTGNAGDLSSIPDNQHKYSRAKRSTDNRSEDQTTKELNQKESSLNGGNAQ